MSRPSSTNSLMPSLGGKLDWESIAQKGFLRIGEQIKTKPYFVVLHSKWALLYFWSSLHFKFSSPSSVQSLVFRRRFNSSRLWSVVSFTNAILRSFFLILVLLFTDCSFSYQNRFFKGFFHRGGGGFSKTKTRTGRGGGSMGRQQNPSQTRLIDIPDEWKNIKLLLFFSWVEEHQTSLPFFFSWVEKTFWEKSFREKAFLDPGEQ